MIQFYALERQVHLNLLDSQDTNVFNLSSKHLFWDSDTLLVWYGVTLLSDHSVTLGYCHNITHLLIRGLKVHYLLSLHSI